MKILKFQILLSFSIILFTSFSVNANRFISKGDAGTTWSAGPVFKGTDNLIHFATSNFTWYVNEIGAQDGGITPAQTYSAISAAYSAWEAVTTDNLTFNDGGLTSSTWGNDDENVHYWAESGDPAWDSDNPFDDYPTASAITVITVNASSEIVDVDILYNGPKVWYLINTNWNDIQSVATHEIGHSFGLHHSELTSLSPLPVMVGSQNPSNNRRELKEDDRAGISFLYGGNIIVNETLSGTDHYDWDINVASGNTLTINSGSIINMYNGSKLKVDGILDVNGTSSSPVTINFQSSNSSNGIWLNDNSHADIDYADIKNGYYGIRSSKSDLKIEHSDIYGVSYGLYLLNHNSTSYEAEIFDNDISAGFNYCIYLYNSDGKIRNNDIHGGTRGIYCNTSSSPKLGEAGYFGINNIHNTSYGIRCYNNSNPFLGRYNCTEQGGLNSFTSCSSYFFYASTNCNVDAENNWWDSSTPNSSKIYAASGCSVDYDPWHHSVPSLKLANTKSEEETLFNVKFIHSTTESMKEFTTKDKKYDYDPKWSIEWKLLYARNLIFVDDFNFAQDICKSIIDEHPDSSLSLYALDLLRQASRYDNENFKEYLLEKTSNNEQKELFGRMELQLNNYETSRDRKLTNLATTELKYVGTNIEESSIFQRFMFAFNDLQDTETAKQIANQLDYKFPKSEYAYEAHVLLDDGKVKPGDEPNNDPKKLGKEATIRLIDKYELLGNYPNPFNPSTTISYSIPATSNISLTIYDMMGRRIKSFEKNGLSAGVHSEFWNGRNENGELVSSGIYIYKFRAISQDGDAKVFEKSNKLMLLK